MFNLLQYYKKSLILYNELMPIHILPPLIVSQIAAGEVVERPASAVKELLENALDAGAKHIAIRVEGAGRRLIEVSDDGGGIQPEDLPLAVERHATSKLQEFQDLFHITTLGFRGEALASIGAVARLTITSHPPEAKTGARLVVEGGNIGPLETTGAPPGTVVRVENLFFNTPARLKFLKKDVTERALIDSLVTRYALAYPHVRMHLHQEGRPVLQTSGNGAAREVLAALYGPDVARQMLEVLTEYDNLRLTGFISPTSLTRSNRREITTFVNGRPVQDAALTAAILQAYQNMLMVGRYPMAILLLELPADMVDVNVHPTKAEVRFQERDQVFSGVQRAVRRALLAYTPVPELYPQDRMPGDLWRSHPGGPARSIDPAWGMAAQSRSDQPLETFTAQSEPSQAGLPVRQVPLLRLVGQVASTYLVAEGPDGLYLIDQHAAHERVLFERFMSRMSDVIPTQALLQPISVELSPASAGLLEPQLPVLERLGFQVEPFGPSTFRVRAIPSILAGSDPSAAIRVLVEDFEEDETPLASTIEARVIARVCKRAAVKAGQTLSDEEQHSLIQDLEACHSPRTCPHGRPTMIHLSVDLLERQFGRKGSL
jgi:DNA mismatch repair protein MutL